jgi:hypothetical protein
MMNKMKSDKMSRKIYLILVVVPTKIKLKSRQVS